MDRYREKGTPMSLTRADRKHLRTSAERKVLARIQAALPQMVARTAATRRLAEGPWSSPTMALPENPPQLTPDEQWTYRAHKDARVLATRRGFRLLTHPGEGFSRVYRDDVPDHPIGIVWVSRHYQAGALLVSADLNWHVGDQSDPLGDLRAVAARGAPSARRGNWLAATPRQALRHAANTHKKLIDEAYLDALAQVERTRRSTRKQERVAAAEDSLGLSRPTTEQRGRA